MKKILEANGINKEVMEKEMGKRSEAVEVSNTPISDEPVWQARAALCELLALSFFYPSKELTQALVSGEYGEAVLELTEILGITPSSEDLQHLQSYTSADVDALFHTLRAEHTRLFIGSPEPVVPPYEGVWFAKDEGVQPLLFVNPHTMEVERFYRSCGIGSAERKNEPLDHVATELEFLQYIASVQAELITLDPQAPAPTKSYEDIYDRFMTEHVTRWMPRFAQATIDNTRGPFFGVAAGVLKGLIGAR